MDFTTQANFQDKLFYSGLSHLLWELCSPFQRYHQRHIYWEVNILPWAGFKPLLKKRWAHLPVALVPSTMYLFEQERCCLFGNRVFSRHQSSITALSLINKVRHWTEWEINHKWQVKHLSARWAFLHIEKENFSASLHKGKLGFILDYTISPHFPLLCKGNGVWSLYCQMV